MRRDRRVSSTASSTWPWSTTHTPSNESVRSGSSCTGATGWTPLDDALAGAPPSSTGSTRPRPPSSAERRRRPGAKGVVAAPLVHLVAAALGALLLPTAGTTAPHAAPVATPRPRCGGRPSPCTRAVSVMLRDHWDADRAIDDMRENGVDVLRAGAGPCPCRAARCASPPAASTGSRLTTAAPAAVHPSPPPCGRGGQRRRHAAVASHVGHRPVPVGSTRRGRTGRPTSAPVPQARRARPKVRSSTSTAPTGRNSVCSGDSAAPSGPTATSTPARGRVVRRRGLVIRTGDLGFVCNDNAVTITGRVRDHRPRRREDLPAANRGRPNRHPSMILEAAIRPGAHPALSGAGPPPLRLRAGTDPERGAGRALRPPPRPSRRCQRVWRLFVDSYPHPVPRQGEEGTCCRPSWRAN